MTPTHIKHLAKSLHRSGTGQASSDAADYAQPSGWAVLQDCLTAALWVAIFVSGAALAWEIQAIDNKPESRTFERADGTTYTRAQSEWELARTEPNNARSGGQEN